MAWNIFKNKEKKEPSRFDQLENKLEDTLKNVQTGKRGVQNKIEEIEDWQAQVIIDTYGHLFPNGEMTYYRQQYKEKALGEYDKIKEENKDQVSEEKVAKCDKIVAAYANQIKLRKSELELYTKLETKYSDALNEFDGMKTGKKSTSLLKQHEARLKDMGDGEDALSGAMTEQERYRRLDDALEHEIIYMQQLESLTNKFDNEAGEDFDHSQAFKDELDKITNAI